MAKRLLPPSDDSRKNGSIAEWISRFIAVDPACTARSDEFYHHYRTYAARHNAIPADFNAFHRELAHHVHAENGFIKIDGLKVTLSIRWRS